jgi:hypothetical protein
LYGNSPSNFPLIGSWRVYHGVWGSGAFQSIYGPAEGIAAAIALVPETFLLSLMLLGLALLSPLWEPLIFAWLGLVATVGLPVMQAIRNALRVHFSATTRTRRVKMVIVTALLNMLQPIARLYGRMVFGLVPWRRRNVTGFSVPRLSNYTLWSENWAPSEGRIQTIEAALKEQGAIVVSGGGYDRWEFEVRAGTLGAVRLRLASEDHGSGKQLIRVRLWPTLPAILVMPVLVLATLSVSAGLHGAFAASAILGGIAAFFALALFFHLGGTMGCAVKVLRHLGYKKV